jgi:hypothetical protein
MKEHDEFIGAIRDNQPIDRREAHAEAGFFVTPLWSLAARMSPAQIASTVTTLRRVQFQTTMKGYLAAARTGVEASAGFTPWEAERQGVETGGSALIGAGRLSIGMSPKVKLVFALDRSLYTATVASLVSPFVTTTPSAGVRLEASWLGEASVQRTMYPDDNSVATTYAWLLAPLAIQSRLTVHAGYAFSFQDARETRFTRAGIYDPYFTPMQEVQHSVAGSLVTWRASGMRLQVNGSYAVYGQRQAPHFSQGPGGPGQGGPPAVVFDTQTFHPYDIHGAATLPLGSAAALTFDAEHVRTSFYHNTRAGAQLSIRFAQKPST